MSDIKQIVNSLGLLAEGNRSRAELILGAAPGPGIDIIFIPDLPVAHNYTIKVMTAAGMGFLKHLYPDQGRIAASSLLKMKRELAEFGLSFHTDWSEVVEVVR